MIRTNAWRQERRIANERRKAAALSPTAEFAKRRLLKAINALTSKGILTSCSPTMRVADGVIYVSLRYVDARAPMSWLGRLVDDVRVPCNLTKGQMKATIAMQGKFAQCS